MLAAHLACSLNIPALLILWETPMHFTQENTDEFMRRAIEQGMDLADDASSSVDMDAVAERLYCPIMVAYGDATRPPVFQGAADLSLIRDGMPNATIEELFLAGADHNLTRGTSLRLLAQFIDAAISFVGRHLKNISSEVRPKLGDSCTTA
jgi:pimeloyl-ACP methyl ester carboxylesterase